MRLLKLKGKAEEIETKESETPPCLVESLQKETQSEPLPLPKKRRGRPPRLTTKAPNVAPVPVAVPINNIVKPVKEVSDGGGDAVGEDDMTDITPEKALQYNTILQDINRKWATISWRI